MCDCGMVLAVGQVIYQVDDTSDDLERGLLFHIHPL
jgi:hypothetical protein